jgi:hypothetical protein
MMNNVISKTKIIDLDQLIRSMINDLISGPSISKDLFIQLARAVNLDSRCGQKDT